MYFKLGISILFLFLFGESRSNALNYTEQTPAIKVETVPSPKSILGEGPHWDIETQSLYYVDILGNVSSINRLDYVENKVYGAKIDGAPIVSFIIPIKGETNKFAVGAEKRLSVIQWDGRSFKAKLLYDVVEVERDSLYNGSRFNDAKADPFNRFYGGTMQQNQCTVKKKNAHFYRYDHDGGLLQIFDDVQVSNGLTWDLERKTFYYIDSCRFNVLAFDYDPKTGAIGNSSVAIDFSMNGTNPGFFPDGMTIDASGNLYVATYGGSKIIKVDPTAGRIIAEVFLPAKDISSAAFGGPNLDILYVTTASVGEENDNLPLAGHLFKITGLGTGLPMQKIVF